MSGDKTPLADALLAQAQAGSIAFDVPGHKGNIPELLDYFGAQCMSLDKNSRRSIDSLNHPISVIREAEALAADAFGAKHAFMMVGGTTSSVQAMVMSACGQEEKIILPRNVHASVINAVILAGAIPVYVNPTIHPTLGISLGMRTDDLKQCIERNTDAKAVVVNNPTYYGVCSDLREIVALAHAHNMTVLADEAHGTHFYFADRLPVAAIHCGADISAVSMHKTGGSLTQSSLLLSGERVDAERIRAIINLTQTTSASYLLLASLDIARRKLVMQGKSHFDALLRRACQARKAINSIDGYYAFGDEIIDGDAVIDFDNTKLGINTLGTGLTGIEVYSILRDEYNIQVEFGDMSNILALPALGDLPGDVEALISALQDIQRKHITTKAIGCLYEYFNPIIAMLPRKAFYAKKRHVPLQAAVGQISGEFIMCYPPGIPLLAPGELITSEIVEHILYAGRKGGLLTGMSADDTSTIRIVD